MANPIIQLMNRNNQGNNLPGIIGALKGNPDEAFQTMMRTNQQFASFVSANKGKTVEQIAAEHNIDLNAIKSLMR